MISTCDYLLHHTVKKPTLKRAARLLVGRLHLFTLTKANIPITPWNVKKADDTLGEQQEVVKGYRNFSNLTRGNK